MPSPPRAARLPVWTWLALAPWAILAARFWFVTDDAYITFRYARNWAEGFGLRYNLGEHVPVEGYSNFLWTAVCAAFVRLGLDPVVAAPTLSALCALALLVRLRGALARHLERDPRRGQHHDAGW